MPERTGDGLLRSGPARPRSSPTGPRSGPVSPGRHEQATPHHRLSSPPVAARRRARRTATTPPPQRLATARAEPRHQHTVVDREPAPPSARTGKGEPAAVGTARALPGGVEGLSQEQWVPRRVRYRQGAEHGVKQPSTCHDDGARRSRRRTALQRGNTVLPRFRALRER